MGQHKPVEDFQTARNTLLGQFRLATAHLEKVIMDPMWSNSEGYHPYLRAVEDMNRAIEAIKNLNIVQLSVNPNQDRS